MIKLFNKFFFKFASLLSVILKLIIFSYYLMIFKNVQAVQNVLNVFDVNYL